MKILLRDKDNHYEPCAIIETDTLTTEEVQELINKVKAEIPDYDSEILTDELAKHDCTVNWICGDEEVYW